MKKWILYLAIAALSSILLFGASTNIDDIKLRLSRYWGYFTIRNNPLLKKLDKDLEGLGADSRVSMDQLLAGGPPAKRWNTIY